MTRTARSISALAACAALLVGCSSAGDDPSGGDSAGQGADPGADSSPPPVSSSPSGTDAASSSPAGEDASGAGGSPPASDAPLEVLPSDPAPSGLPGLSPAPRPGTPLLRRPLPAGASADDALVEGYPDDVLPATPDSTIESSSLSPHGRRLQVALSASTTSGPGAVLLFYRQQLASLGFTEESVPAAAGTRAAGFRRGQNAATVTVERAGDTSSYTLFATLYAG
ncbi:hypothetical protein [Nocardioides sp. LHG3406-4]|uniref:hypothetical protein n=1 Tax=Nocardioides sp. LHG3406-4 TaxID=2804575 RepID=UPI003CF8D775